MPILQSNLPGIVPQPWTNDTALEAQSHWAAVLAVPPIGADMVIERQASPPAWVPGTGGGGGAYASLTGAGETETPGDLAQAGGFIVDDAAGDGIIFSTAADGAITLLGAGTAGINIDQNSATDNPGGINLTDQGGSGILLKEGDPTTSAFYLLGEGGGAELFDDTDNSLTIQEIGTGILYVQNLGTVGGVQIIDAGGGLNLTERGAGGIELLDEGNGGITLVDQGTSGIYLATTAGPMVIQVQTDASLKLSGNSGEAPIYLGGEADQVSLYGGPAVLQPAAIPAPAGGAVVDAEARAAITAILGVLGAAAGGIGITA